jgi:hypothetical protein
MYYYMMKVFERWKILSVLCPRKISLEEERKGVPPSYTMVAGLGYRP